MDRLATSQSCPSTATTLREGRPYTLVLTKQVALFEREAADRSRRKTLLTWLKGQHHAFAAAPKPTRSPGRDAGSTALS